MIRNDEELSGMKKDQTDLKSLFVPYEVAELAKSCGFNEECLAWTTPGEPEFIISYCAKYSTHSFQKKIQIPTYQQIIDWLEKNHHIIIRKSFDGSYYEGSRGFESHQLQNKHFCAINIKSIGLTNTNLDNILKETFDCIKKMDLYSSEILDHFFTIENEIERKRTEDNMILAATIADAIENDSSYSDLNQFAFAIGVSLDMVEKWLSGTYTFNVHELIQIQEQLRINLINIQIK